MTHHFATINAASLAIPTVIIVLGLYVSRVQDTCFIDIPTGTPMSEVLPLVLQGEKEGVRFDLLDGNLWIEKMGGTRLFGMFDEDLH